MPQPSGTITGHVDQLELLRRGMYQQRRFCILESRSRITAFNNLYLKDPFGRDLQCGVDDGRRHRSCARHPWPQPLGQGPQNNLLGLHRFLGVRVCGLEPLLCWGSWAHLCLVNVFCD